MKILAIEKDDPEATTEDFRPLLKTEARVVWELYQAGVIRELYFEREEHLAVLALECSSVEEARFTLNKLPLVQAGLIEFTLFPLIPYDGFQRLFEGRDS